MSIKPELREEYLAALREFPVPARSGMRLARLRHLISGHGFQGKHVKCRMTRPWRRRGWSAGWRVADSKSVIPESMLDGREKNDS